MPRRDGEARSRRPHALSRLGLRAGEVAGLGLDDIDWHHGELVVRGKGSRRESPALARRRRRGTGGLPVRRAPPGREPGLFLRMHAPIGAMCASNVTMIVRRACERAGVAPAGAHRLRHSTATAMLRDGASLREVGQVLRHNDDTVTAIYAKVDRVALRTLAQPWPGATA